MSAFGHARNDGTLYRDRVDLLVVGGSGFLGREITRQARRAGHSVAATFHSRGPAVAEVDWRNLDIRCRDDVTALVLAARPDVIVNAAFRQSDWTTTAEGGMHVALAAALVGTRLVHVSSDAVFSGTTTVTTRRMSRIPRHPTAPPKPPPRRRSRA
jgi:dTDP-4-dehydrorhamnose reductase